MKQKMEKVWVVINKSVIECEDSLAVMVYSSLEKAKEAFDQLVENDIAVCDPEWELEREDLVYETYEKGYYATNHVYIAVYERDLDPDINKTV